MSAPDQSSEPVLLVLIVAAMVAVVCCGSQVWLRWLG